MTELKYLLIRAFFFLSDKHRESQVFYIFLRHHIYIFRDFGSVKTEQLQLHLTDSSDIFMKISPKLSTLQRGHS